MARLLIFDGHCGLCHESVKFVMRHDPQGVLFRFTPSSSPFGQYELSRLGIDLQPRSVVLVQENGEILFRSNAALAIMSAAQFPWPTLAEIAGWIPQSWRDWVYERISQNRRYLFSLPPTTCPIVPSSERYRYILEIPKR